jgi:hypothetical protein
MTQALAKSRKPKARVLGTKAFVAISTVEGLRLSASSRKRLDLLKASGLTTEERRAEVLRTYASLGKKR